MTKLERQKIPDATKRKLKSPLTIIWLSAPAKHDYPAAESYLRLLAGHNLVNVCSGLLSQAPTMYQHAKDILRAAKLPLLGVEDPEVVKDISKIMAGISLSPILLIRGDLATGRPLQIADGYHRVCATYHVSEDTEIPCRLVSLPSIVI